LTVVGLPMGDIDSFLVGEVDDAEKQPFQLLVFDTQQEPGIVL
jgi:hypothetical protein